MLGRSMNLRKLDSLRYAFCDPGELWAMMYGELQTKSIN
jgi:hypothetical protein